MIDYKTYPKIEDYINFSNNRLSKSAIFLVLGLLIGLLFLMSSIPYNDVISAKCIITSQNPIIHITARSNGHLIKSNLKHGDLLQKDDYIGFISGHGNYKSVLNLEKILKADSLNIKSLQVLNRIFYDNSDIGLELNLRLTNFMKAYSDYIILNDENYKKLLETELADNINANKKNSFTKTQELNYSKIANQNSFDVIERFRKLHAKGVVSTQDLQLKEHEYHQQIQSSKKLQSELISSNSELNKSILNETRNLEGYSESVSKIFIQLRNTREILLTEIDEWKNKNILISPKHGRIAFYNFNNDYKNVEIGDTIYSIISANKTDLMAKMKTPIHNSSKVLPKQRVLLKLDNYPFSEWGNLKGRIKVKSDILNYSDDIGYMTLIDIESSTTTYGKEILIAEDMVGTAEIILEKTSVLKRIFYQFKSIWLNE